MIKTTISSFRAKMKQYIDLVTQSHETILISRKGNEDEGMVMMSIQEYNAMYETAHLLSTRNNQRRLLEALNQVANGETVSFNLSD